MKPKVKLTVRVVLMVSGIVWVVSKAIVRGKRKSTRRREWEGCHRNRAEGVPLCIIMKWNETRSLFINVAKLGVTSYLLHLTP